VRLLRSRFRFRGDFYFPLSVSEIWAGSLRSTTSLPFSAWALSPSCILRARSRRLFFRGSSSRSRNHCFPPLFDRSVDAFNSCRSPNQPSPPGRSSIPDFFSAPPPSLLVPRWRWPFREHFCVSYRAVFTFLSRTIFSQREHMRVQS